ncbi:hypothetical protein CRE_06157 [Caenorhabditis remanei]|uniref:PAN-3 domain-containing protein n=1 Tax=Caenorhabditis remanei TaxID=31234 RepID=E3NGV8_CAERE|nr:hypothetical protein CRE_06157 [Caenorhabditis remanei]
MKYTFLFLISISLFSSVNCICETNCSCPDILTLGWWGRSTKCFLAIENPKKIIQGSGNIETYEEGIGCTRKIMCYKLNYDDGLMLDFKETEIPIPSDKDPNNDWLQAPTQDEMYGMVSGLIDVFSYFGIVCENGTWYATKYPHGIVYANAGSGFTGPSDEYNGKKSKIDYFRCLDWRTFHESPPMPFQEKNGIVDPAHISKVIITKTINFSFSVIITLLISVLLIRQKITL